MALGGRLAKGALDAFGGKKYTGTKTTGARAKDIVNVAATGGVKGRRSGTAVRNPKTGRLRGVSESDVKAASTIRKGAAGAALAGGAAAVLSSQGDEKAEATETPKKKKGLTAFEKAFRKARREGKKTFMFEGKKYTTELRKPRQPSPKAKPKAPAKKAYGGKVMKRKGGGNMVYRKHGGRGGEKTVSDCYDN